MRGSIEPGRDRSRLAALAPRRSWGGPTPARSSCAPTLTSTGTVTSYPSRALERLHAVLTPNP